MGRILGLDFGTRRVGAALSDPRGKIASPLEVYERRTPTLDARHYRDLVANEGIERLVIGLPLHTDGREGDSARLVREFGAWLGKETERPVTYHDERYTTVEAEEILRMSGQKSRDRRTRRDMLAAQILLQAFLDAGSPTDESPGLSLADESAGHTS